MCQKILNLKDSCFSCRNNCCSWGNMIIMFFDVLINSWASFAFFKSFYFFNLDLIYNFQKLYFGRITILCSRIFLISSDNVSIVRWFFIDTVMKGLCSIMLIIVTKFLLSMGRSYIFCFGSYFLILIKDFLILIKVDNTQWHFTCKMNYCSWCQAFLFVDQNVIIGDSFISSLSSWVYWHLGWLSVGVSGKGGVWDDLGIRTLIQYKDIISPI